MKRSNFAMFTIAAIAIMLAGVACIPGKSGGGNTPDDARKVVDAPIDGIEILTRESFPPGYTAHITSGLPSGCAQFSQAVITGREGNTITISVTNTLPADDRIACTAIYGYHETNLDLGQDFKSGETYTVHVNDKTKSFVAQ